ncbi:unnamed protein product [Aureobasidium vineae]|uniref:Uncharacterized protein n=1 Tax=Aureobasidium vineae TaxID=2773715 RepID=A0A9N8PE22_9PEZI|nr:unnamed protein product [Aureobasidium vineae]
MSQNLMDTQPGGDTEGSTQPSTPSQCRTRSPADSSATSVDFVPEVEAAKKAEDGEKTAEKIRYGQSLSENGMGGQTTGLGQANSSSAGSEAQNTDADAVSEREMSGYGGDKDMDRNIGA